jgi:hypothetical protein
MPFLTRFLWSLIMLILRTPMFQLLVYCELLLLHGVGSVSARASMHRLSTSLSLSRGLTLKWMIDKFVNLQQHVFFKTVLKWHRNSMAKWMHAWVLSLKTSALACLHLDLFYVCCRYFVAFSRFFLHSKRSTFINNKPVSVAGVHFWNGGQIFSLTFSCSL